MDAPDTEPADRDQTEVEPAEAESIERSPADLIQLHGRGIWRYLRTLGCDAARADDLTQETFLRVLRRDSFVQHSDAATAGYLRRTAYNLMISEHRKNKRTQTVPDATSIDEIWDRWAGKDLTGDTTVDALRDCLDGLSDRARMALRMRFQGESSRVEIAEKLGISDHGARNLMQRAKATLKQCVESKLTNKSNE